MLTVFRGTWDATTELPTSVEVWADEGEQIVTRDGFEAVCSFSHLDDLNGYYPDKYRFAQAIIVDEIEEGKLGGIFPFTVRVLNAAVRSVIVFPVDACHRHRLKSYYIPAGVPFGPGEKLWYFLTSFCFLPERIIAIPRLDVLHHHLFSGSECFLHVVKVNNFEWETTDFTAVFHSGDVLDHRVVPVTIRIFRTGVD
jgi:hypothetical protein